MNTSHVQGRTVRLGIWLTALMLVFSYFLTALTINLPTAHALEVSTRSIELSTSEEGATATYVISFTVPDAGAQNIGSFRVEFCNDNPLPGVTCTFTSGDNVPDLDSAALTSASFDDTGGTDECTTVSLASVSAGDRQLDFTCDAVDDISGPGNFTATVSGIVNPTNATESPTNPNNTFYARLYVFTTTTPTAMANPVVGFAHSGGAAMSTAEQLTITARVQEVLEFCVGDTAVLTASSDDCTGVSGNDIDLGVLDFASVNTAAVEDSNGYAMVRTNASAGVVVDYFANNGNADDSETDGFPDGHLAVTGVQCDFPATATDQCINSRGLTEDTIAAGTEHFGMAVTSINNTAGGTTTNLVRDGAYDNGSGGYAFDGSGATDRIAASSTVVDDETLVLDWAGTASITTPTGVYTTVLTFIATATF